MLRSDTLGRHPHMLRATLWEANPDLTAILRTIFTLADLDLDVVFTARALLTAAAQAGPNDFLILDCSRALPADIVRCTTITTQTTVPVHIIHPRAEMIADVKIVARGSIIGVPSEHVGVVLLEKLYLLKAMCMSRSTLAPLPVEITAVPLTMREHEVLRQLAEGCRDKQIAVQLGIKPGTVKTYVARIKVKLGITARQELMAAYHRRRTDPVLHAPTWRT